MTRRTMAVLFGLTATLTLASCTGGKNDRRLELGPNAVTIPGASTTPGTLLDPGVTSNTVGGPRVACKVQVTGALDAEFTTYDDRAAFSSDHYLSTDDIAEAAIPKGITTLPGQTLPEFTAPPRAEGTAPLAGWFLLNCQGGDISISFFSNPASTASDVPFAPGSYVVTPATGAGATDEMFVTVSFFNDPTLQFGADTGARLTIDRFDTRGAAGSFVVPMIELVPAAGTAPRSVELRGDFVVTCHGGALCGS